jgi:chromosome segregation ATPase
MNHLISSGGSLDRILVDTFETATACLKYLKDNGVGRANMLTLEKTARFASKVNCNFKVKEFR